MTDDTRLSNDPRLRLPLHHLLAGIVVAIVFLLSACEPQNAQVARDEKGQVQRGRKEEQSGSHLDARENDRSIHTMSTVAEILDSFRELRLENEDGFESLLELETAASKQEIQSREASWGMKLPGQLGELMQVTNGMYLFGLEIMSLGALDEFPEYGLIAFHNWGNGDFDCVTTSSSKYPAGTIVFMNHSPDVTVKVADSLAEWLTRVVQEERDGGVAHPMDLQEHGVYRHVLDELKGVDCELTRRFPPKP